MEKIENVIREQMQCPTTIVPPSRSTIIDKIELKTS